MRRDLFGTVALDPQPTSVGEYHFFANWDEDVWLRVNVAATLESQVGPKNARTGWAVVPRDEARGHIRLLLQEDGIYAHLASPYPDTMFFVAGNLPCYTESL